MAGRRQSYVALGLALATACSAPAADEPAPVEKALVLGSCDSLDLDVSVIPEERRDGLELGCGVLEAPLDHDDPDAGTVDIEVVRARSDDQVDRIGSLVLNPGGPGQAGTAYFTYWLSWLPDELLERFDIVTFDPRGTGFSDPINCAPPPSEAEVQFLPDLSTETGFAAAASLTSEAAEVCLAELGDRAPYFNTTATAGDLDLVREALGDEKLTYLGFSYGARLGGEYARQFPDRVRALALDAPSDPLADPMQQTLAQLAGFEASFDAWADGCPDRPTCEPLGDPRRFVADLIARAESSPILSRRPGDELPASGADVLDGIVALLYTDNTWAPLDEVLLETEQGDSGGLFAANDAVFNKDPLDDDTEGPDASDAGYVINCNDRPPGPTDEEIRAVARTMDLDGSPFARYFSWQLFGCAAWPAERHVPPLPDAPTADPVLVVGTVHDPATPYAGAVRFTEALGGSGHLLTWEGEGHTAFGRSDCVTEAVTAYLVDLELPPDETRCPA